MKSILFTLIFSCVSISLFAQKKMSIIATYPVYRVWLPGTMPVDQNGNQVRPKANIERSIFVTSTKDTAPTFSNIYYDKVAVKFSVQKPNEKEINSQVDFEGNKIKFTQPKSSFVWKIDIVALAGKSIPEKPKTIKLLLNENKKTTTIIAKKETELMTIPTY
jgi:hypothetical protein